MMSLTDIRGRRILKEERNYILQMIKKIRASGANVLLIQKSILRDAVTDLSLHYLVRPGVPINRGAMQRVDEKLDLLPHDVSKRILLS